jgi:hypothetical protein
MSDMDGAVRLLVEHTIVDDTTRMRADIRAERLTFEGQSLDAARISLSNADAPSRLDISEAVADYLDGRVNARGWVNLPSHPSPGEFGAWVSLDAVDVTSLFKKLQPIQVKEGASTGDTDIASAGPTSDQTERANSMLSTDRGRAYAGISIAGTMGDISSRRGRGEILISEAELFHVPLAMWALQISSLTLPLSNSFESANIAFYIDGGRLVFERIDLESPMIHLSGSGSVAYESGDVELDFHTSSRLRAPLISDMWERLRNRLVSIQVRGRIDKSVTHVAPKATN